MTKKQIIALADVIKAAQNGSAEFSTDQIELLADFCDTQNPNFKRERWLDYIADKCGPNGGR